MEEVDTEAEPQEEAATEEVATREDKAEDIKVS